MNRTIKSCLVITTPIISSLECSYARSYRPYTHKLEDYWSRPIKRNAHSPIINPWPRSDNKYTAPSDNQHSPIIEESYNKNLIGLKLYFTTSDNKISPINQEKAYRYYWYHPIINKLIRIDARDY